ncbi:hypothetical protein BU24DRAFT_427860 [Aaosphaeria arxii CBS 175.79]|uniref:DNA helicase n=1 Tax=Aaosphaeria arxii CBS 175.79 TaxID=1450172 RepID=A0A6A5X9V5_9PLEO|nr:uncharacterized protein BU24DRAFT_427860 [Aaosphaeria arxii CBS 175.79]KAF2009835.1 hypothetical protein BU24DRAFT_427860 [Aaosphaeria arxii CBS 175.79]
MYRPDPILSSSPLRPSSRPSPTDASEDELAVDYVTQPTQPLSSVKVDGTRSQHFAPGATRHMTQQTIPYSMAGRAAIPGGSYITQPTQPLDPQTLNRNSPPQVHRASSPQRKLPSGTQPTQILSTPPRPQTHTHVQVVRSSPSNDRHSSPLSQTQRAFPSSMAPPGTIFVNPPRVARPAPIDLTAYSDPPVESDPDEEDDFRSNIKPSDIETWSTNARIQETPPQRVPNFSQYAYNGTSQAKRSADSSFASNSPQKRMRPMQRQSGPSRAMPVGDVYMRITDIKDDALRIKVQRLKSIYATKTLKELMDKLDEHGGEYEATRRALSQPSPSNDKFYMPKFLRDGSSDVEIIPAPQPKKTAQRFLNAPIKSIRERYRQATPDRESSPQLITSSPAAAPPKKKGRLQRGRKNRTPEPASSPQRQPTPIALESDSDEAIGTDEEDEASDDVADSPSLLEFFNTCSVEAMVDLSNEKVEDVRALLEHRPFRSMAQIEKINLEPDNGKKKARRPKVAFGAKLMAKATEMWDGFMAVDDLVRECENAGKPIANAMAQWGVDVFGSSTDGEVAITNLEDKSDATHDSGIGTPRSSHGSDTEVDPRRRRSNFVKKPSNMNAEIELKDYQLVGLNWLALLYQNGVSGILADDMGLGKTCQVIAFLSHLKEQQMPGPHLVIVPGSTLENWLREFKRFSKKMRVEVYYGSQPARAEQQQVILDAIDEGRVDVIITTYDLAHKKDDNSFLRKCRPKACVYDEGHYLRNSATQRYKMLMRIKAEFRLLLTGTPLQNSLRELVSILAFIMPDIFENVSDNLEAVFKSKAKVNDSDTHGALLSTQRIQRARSMMTPFVLRRKKAQVLKHLPQKTCRVEYCDLLESQAKLYATQLERQKRVLLDRANGIIPKDHANIMMKLRQAAIHPLLFRDRYNDKVIRKMAKACLKEPIFADSQEEYIYEDLTVYTDFQCNELSRKYPKTLGKFALKNEEWMDSGKVQKLAELLKKYKENGDRALVFSQFTSVMDILQLVFETLDIAYSRIDGSTPIGERQPLIDQYYEDDSITVFMLSTKSGGAGINLACANKVIIFDSSFNPQDDIQAENRAHRVGQTRDVEVVRFVTKGTVEEQIHALGVSKLELDKMVAGEEGESAGNGKKGAKADAGAISAAEEQGIDAVERMMLEQLQKQDEGKDVKEKFLDGMKAAGIPMAE